MKTSTATATATTSRGTIININATASRGFEMKEEVSFCDGDNVTINVAHKTNETNITLCFAGMTLIGNITTRRPSPTTPLFFGYFLSNDNKSVYPFEQSVYQTIENCKNEAVAEAEKDESWMEMVATENRDIETEKQYDAHVANMKKAMSY